MCIVFNLKVLSNKLDRRACEFFFLFLSIRLIPSFVSAINIYFCLKNNKRFTRMCIVLEIVIKTKMIVFFQERKYCPKDKHKNVFKGKKKNKICVTTNVFFSFLLSCASQIQVYPGKILSILAYHNRMSTIMFMSV